MNPPATAEPRAEIHQRRPVIWPKLHDGAGWVQGTVTKELADAWEAPAATDPR